MKTRQLCYTALFAALTAVCSQLVIPTPWMIPISMSTLAVFLSGALLGAKWGTLAQAVYLLLGLAGVPVFAGFRGGFQVLAGPTGGYLIGYLAAAALTGLLVSRVRARWMPPLAMAVGLAACYAFGTVWFMVLNQTALGAALGMCVLPYLPGDAVKIAVASVLTWKIGALRLTKSPACV
ncbi:MAG: biotin transporter BioY [Butyricicoccus sp.]